MFVAQLLVCCEGQDQLRLASALRRRGETNCPSPGGWLLLALPIISADAPGRTARPKFLSLAAIDERPEANARILLENFILLEDLTLSRRDGRLILEDSLHFAFFSFLLYLVFLYHHCISYFYFRVSYLIFYSDWPLSSRETQLLHDQSYLIFPRLHLIILFSLPLFPPLSGLRSRLSTSYIYLRYCPNHRCRSKIQRSRSKFQQLTN